MTACGGGGGNGNFASPPPSSPTITSVTVTPNSATPVVSTTQQFTANVQGTGTFNSAVTWMVNNIAGGNPTVGTISFLGLYTAPAGLPSPATVTIQAVSVQDSTKSGTASVTVSPENVQIAISPSSASVQLGATQKLNISVTGTANLSYSLTINGQTLNAFSPWGTLDSTGLYTAPTVLPSASVVTITATSLEDTTKSASASITILATAGGINVSVSPQNSTVVFDGSQSVQFNATVSGTTNTSVSWSVGDQYGNPFGQITSSGLFTPPIQDCNSNNRVGTVRATSIANSGAQAATTINLVPPIPVITAVSPQPAPAQATLQITGTFPTNGTTTVNYPAPNGATISGGKTVPLGSSSGSLSVQIACGSFPAMTSNSVPFVRQPRLRIRADKKDLVVGESVQLHATFLGDPMPQPVDWGTGISSSGLYTAALSMGGTDSFVPLTACIQNTNVCDSVIVRVNPLAIEPLGPTVASGGTLQLTALNGGGSVVPTWSILSGGGSLLSDGTYTAPTVPQDGGPVVVSATSGGNTATATIAVTGNQPGLVNRVSDYLDYNNPTPPMGTLAKSIAVDGNRAYALSVDSLQYWGVPKECWIDAYDITDPIHPVWIDAAEALNGDPPISTCTAQLYAYGNVLYEFLGGTITTYSVVNSKLQLQQVWNVPGSTFDLEGPSFNKGVFYALPATINPAVNGSPISVLVFDFTSGTLVQRSLNLPLPQPGVPATTSFPAGSGNLLYILVGQPSLKLATYDISTNSPVLVSVVDALVGATAGSGGTPKVFGKTLFDRWDVYDISGGVPVRTGTSAINFSDVSPNTSLGLYGLLPVGVADVSDPSSPKTVATLDDSGGSYFAGNPVWAGDGTIFYQTETTGGWGIFSAPAPGGQILQGRLPDKGGYGTMFGQLVSGKYLYTAEQTDNGPFVNIYDLSTTPPTLVGYYSESGQDPLSLALLGNILYVGTAEGLLVLDISSPASPAKVATIQVPTSSLATSGNALYSGTTDNRLVVFDVSNPKNPTQITQINLPGFPINTTVAGNLLLVADNTAGLLTFNIATPSRPILLSQYQAPSSSATVDVAADGTVVLVAAADGGLVTLDVSNPSAPKLVSQVNLSTVACMNTCVDVTVGPPAAVSIAVNNGIAYVGGVGTIYGMVFGFDYRVPAYPRLVSTMGYGGALVEEVLTFGFYQSQMFVGGDIGAVAARQVDISQPRNVINLYYPSFPSGSGQLSKPGTGRRTSPLHPKINRGARRSPSNPSFSAIAR